MPKLIRDIQQGVAPPFLLCYHEEPSVNRAVGISLAHPLPIMIPNDASKLIVARWGNADGNIDDVRMDASTHSLQTVTYEHHEIHSGSHYFVIGYQDLSINNVLDFTWQMPDTTKWAHWTWKISTESETMWHVYENAVVVNPLANLITPFNSNRNSGNTSGTIMRFELQANLAGANADTNVAGATLLESGISGAGKDAGSDSRDNELVMQQNTLYCLRAIATAAGYINFNMQFYEHTDRS